MKHLLLAVLIGGLTIGVSIYLLAERDESYENDAKVNREIVLNESFEGVNYNLTALEYGCDTFESTDNEESSTGCVLEIELTNTTDFVQILNLDGDKIVTTNGEEIESSADHSRRFIEDNQLIQDVLPDQTVTGGIFFPADENIVAEEAHIFETNGGEPIVVQLRN